jgi:pimeloyl-ACP methyl ester carboxylesterase
MGARERPALLVGWSLGAIALLRAVLSPDGASLPAVLLLAGSARLTAADAYEGADPRALRAMRMRLSREPRAVLAGFAALCAAPDVAASDFASRYVEQSGAVPAGALQEGLEFLEQTDLRGRLGRWAVPVKWLHGECDAVVPVQSARWAAARAPNIQLEVLSGRGHALPWIAVDEVARHVRGLLEWAHPWHP